jgi:predicted MFS family arabinose efflux permease
MNDARGGRERGADANLFTIAALCLVFNSAAMSGYVMPLLAGALIKIYGYSLEDIGIVIAVELAMIAFGGFLIFPFLSRRNLRLWLALSMGVIIAANLWSASIVDGALFMAARGFAGAAEGVAQAAVISIAARLSNSDRAFTRIYTVFSLFLALTYFVVPEIMNRWSHHGVLFWFAILAAFGLAALSLMQLPDPPSAARSQAADKTRWSASFLAVIFAWIAFIIGQMSIFAYLERIANDIGMSFETTNIVFGLSTIATIGAAWLAGWAMPRFGLTRPVIAATLLSAGAIVGFAISTGAFSYGVFLVMLNAAVFFAFPLFTTLGSRIDPTGRLPSMLPASQAFAMAIGPAAASAILGASGSFARLAVAAAFVTLFALIAAIPALIADRRHARSTDV